MCESHFYKKLFTPEVEKEDTLGFGKLACNYRRAAWCAFLFCFFSYLTSVASIEVGSETQ